MAKYPGRCPKNQELDLYTGCSFGCRYCIAHARHAAPPALSPRFAEALAQAELANPDSEPFYLSPWTDAYQPLEAEHGATRAVLERLAHRRAPFFVITRSPLVLRDVEYLTGRDNAFVALSLDSLDAELTTRLEPAAPSPASRLEAAVHLREAGVRVVIKLDPILPGLSDGDALDALMDAIVAVRPLAVTAETLRLDQGLAARLAAALSDDELARLSAHYPSLSSAPVHATLHYRQAIFDRIARRFEAVGIRACFCRASLPSPITAWDCRGGFDAPLTTDN